jgi:ketol-acid reductoisomerase
MMKLFHHQDIRHSLIADKTIAVIGYGNQGAAHAQNLRDSGINVIVGARANSASGERARAAGFTVMKNSDAVQTAAIVMLMTPDETHHKIYAADIVPHLNNKKTLGFCHGLAVHFGYITPPVDVDVILVSPKVPGYVLRQNHQTARGSLCLVGAHQNPSGQALNIALAYAAAISGGDAGLLESSFEDECVTNLFGEQAVLCGGIPEVIKAAFDTLVAAGYPEELAWSECLNQTKLLVDLIVAGGIKQMREKISNTAEYGGLISGARIIDDRARAEMQKILAEIRSGDFARAWLTENESGNKNFQKLRNAEASHASEIIGEKMRTLILGGEKNKEAA